MQTITEQQTKTIAKEIVKLSKENTPLKHSNVLEIISHSLGYRDYNALSAKLKTLSLLKEKSEYEPTRMIHSEPLSEVIKRVEEKQKSMYPDIDQILFAKPPSSGNFEELIHGSFDGEKWTYNFLIRLKKNITKRVFYSPRYKSFSLFVYPDVKDPANDYEIPIGEISDSNLYKEYFNIIHHLHEKKWMTEELFDDLMNLMVSVAKNRYAMDERYETMDKRNIDIFYQDNKPDGSNKPVVFR